MLRIGVCVGECETQQKLENYIDVFFQNAKVKYEVEIFRNGADFFKFVKEQAPLELLFLDTELEDMTGIEIGQRLRASAENEVTQIIFLSDKENYAMQLFALRPLNFFLKPVSRGKISSVLAEYLRLYGENPRFFQYSFAGHIIRILLSQIILFQCCGKKVVIETSDGIRQEYYGNMKDLAARVGNHFFCQIHKSYIVNINYVSKVKPNQVVMLDGTVLPISRANKKKVEKWLQYFLT